VLPPIVDAVSGLVTLGEVVDALRSVFGEHHESAGW
jgi:methylmalonyl-CoA mutase N-terminal domain/subunit